MKAVFISRGWGGSFLKRKNKVLFSCDELLLQQTENFSGINKQLQKVRPWLSLVVLQLNYVKFKT